MRSPRLPLALVLASTFLLSGCTVATPSEGDGPTPQPSDIHAAATALETALDRMPAEGGPVSVSFTDVHRADELGAYESGTSPFATAGALGFGQLASIVKLLEGVVPDGALENATATSAGIAPDGVVRFDGVPSPSETFADIAGERSELAGGTLLVRRDDHEIDFDDADFPPQVLAHLNVVWFDDSTIIAGTSRAGVESWVTVGGSTVSSTFPGVAACLGVAVGATVMSADAARASRDVGVATGESGGAPVQTLCVSADDPQAAVDRIAARIDDDADPVSGRSWAELLGDAAVEEAGDGWVRVRTTDGVPDIFFSVLVRGSIGELVD